MRVLFVSILVSSIANPNCGCLMPNTCICLPCFVLQGGTEDKPEEEPSDKEMQYCFSQSMSCVLLFVLLTARMPL